MDTGTYIQISGMLEKVELLNQKELVKRVSGIKGVLTSGMLFNKMGGAILNIVC